ncbi:hypothetical protein, partial [Acinetobacter baumannii]|uniref:hypothetical protein n=1 Tax=Acinetobacter baumannii TaxID=470 RepID=UPI001BB46A34
PKTREVTKESAKETAPAQVAMNVPKPAEAKPHSTMRDMAQRAKNAVLSIASNDKPTMVEKLWGKQPSHG